MKELKTLWYIFLALALVPFLLFYMKAEGMTEQDSQKVIELIENAKLTEKQAIVAEVKHTENKWPRYTIRVGLGGSRKPIPTIRGVTTEERAKEWLETAWLGYTLPTWIKLGEQHKIDYTLPICIAWADSHLGKALKSKNNIGNVWNNDRGDVVHYDTLEKGIGAIFRTLNNRYMKDNHLIGLLSGGWRVILNLKPCAESWMGHKCYATSLDAWDINVTNCMSAIHDKKIDENYQFKL